MNTERFLVMASCVKIGTVVVRVRDSVVGPFRAGDGGPGPDAGYSRIPDQEPSDDDCERCARTGCSAPYSDCVSETYYRKPRRTSMAWRRYVKFCTAVCLLLVIGSLSPQASAAPYRYINGKKMDRTERDTTANEENSLWSNPCDYKNVKDTPVVEYNPNSSRILASLAKNVKDKAAAYKNEFAFKIHSYQNFEVLLADWENNEWLRKYPWFKEEILPKEKNLGQPISDEYMDNLMTNIDDVLPNMYKSLKMVVAALDSMHREGLTDEPLAELKQKVYNTMHDVRGVLCQFNEIMTSRNREILKIDSNEIPKFDNSNTEKHALLLVVYRDTLNLLEYVSQVFDKLYAVGTTNDLE